MWLNMLLNASGLVAKFPLWAYLNEKETEDECCEECWNEKVACTCMSKDE
jgi:hypothetical protein